MLRTAFFGGNAASSVFSQGRLTGKSLTSSALTAKCVYRGYLRGSNGHRLLAAKSGWQVWRSRADISWTPT